jgi:hypothetical protein
MHIRGQDTIRRDRRLRACAAVALLLAAAISVAGSPWGAVVGAEGAPPGAEGLANDVEFRLLPAPPVQTAADPPWGTRALAGSTCTTPVPAGPLAWAPQGVGDDGCPRRWDPCVPIDWWYNPAGQLRPLSEVQEAVARVGSLSGLPFRYRGTTTLTSDGWASFSPAVPGLGMLIEWDATISSIGLARVLGMTTPSGAVELVHAAVSLNSSDSLTVAQWRAVILHEVAHVAGLDHIDDPTQLMYERLTNVVDFGAGDRQGLWWIGSVQGCMPGGIRAEYQMPTEPPPPPQLPPVGSLDDLWVEGRTVRVRGWAADPNHSPIAVVFGRVVFGRGVEVGFALTDRWRPDVAAAVPGASPTAGFEGAVVLPPGQHTVCVGALDHDGTGSTGDVVNLGCRQVVVK